MRKKIYSRREFLRGALAATGAVAAAGLASCAPPATPVPAAPEATPTPAPAKVEITYAFHDDSKPREQMVKVFNETVPDVVVNLLQIPEDFPTKVLTMAAAGTLPDVVRMWEAMVLEMGRAGQVIDLQPMIDAEPDFHPEDFLESLYNFTLIDGKRFGISDGWAGHYAFYNKDLFDAGEVPYPEAEWTWDVYVDKAKMLSKPEEKIWGSDTIPIGWTHYSFKFIWQNGGRVFNDDYTECLLDRPEAIEGIQFWADLLQQAEIMPTPAQAEGLGDLFQTGRVAIQRMGSWIMRALAQGDFAWDLVPEPKRKERRTLIHTAFNAIANISKHKDAAWKWLNFAVGPEGSYIYTSYLTFPATRRSVNERKPWVIEGVEASWDFIPEAGEYGIVVPAPPNEGEVLKLIGDAFQAIYLGKQTAEEALTEVTPKVNEALRREM
ncbi:MAG TPA: sugar ABC transporter substrate-binding protein [Caldilineae bacterium]|nr:sugar ABC transporter substrate-binding protein [Caldilineae bacterium]